MNGDGSPSPAPPGAARAIRAVRWTLIGSIAQRLITFCAVAVVARVLGETEYGAYRQMLAVHLVLFVLLPLGFDQLYIREVRQRSHFALLLGGALNLSAIVLGVLVLAGHYIFAEWLNLEQWSGMLWVFPAVIALQARKLIYKTDLAARLDYRKISYGETLYALVSGLGGVLLVLIWPSAWCLYISYGCAELAELLWLRRGRQIEFPALAASLAMLRKDGLRWRRFGLYHCGTQVLNALGGNAPVIIFGAALSKAAAAAFSMASFLVTVPIFVMIGALHRVAFSALAGRTREQLPSPVLQILRLAATFIVPVLVWVAIMAEPLVYVILGEGWVESTAPVAQLLSLYCIFVALFSPISSLDLLLDRPDYGFFWNGAATVIRVAAVIVGLGYGVMPAVVAYAVTSAVLWVVWGVMLAHLLGARQWKFHKVWLMVLPLWILLALLLAGVLTLTDNPWAALTASVLPAGVYLGLLMVFYKDTVQQGMRLVKR